MVDEQLDEVGQLGEVNIRQVVVVQSQLRDVGSAGEVDFAQFVIGQREHPQRGVVEGHFGDEVLGKVADLELLVVGEVNLGEVVVNHAQSHQVGELSAVERGERVA